MIRRIVPLLLILVLIIAPASAAVTRTWNQSSTSSALSGCMDENYASITCPDFNATEPWSSMGRVNISGQTMVHVPKFWYRVDNVTIGGMHLMNFSVSAVPLSGYSVHSWFIINNTIIPEQYIGAYEASIYNVTSGTYVGDPASVNSQPGGDLLSSVAGQKPVSGLGKASLTLPGFRNTSHSRGIGWELQSFNGMSAIQLLYIVEKGDWNTQTTIGTGVTQITDDSTTNMAIPTGLTAGVGANSTDCGNFTCSVATVHYQTHQNTNQVSFRGYEGGLGNINEWWDGINVRERVPYVASYNFSSTLFSVSYVNTGLTLTSSTGYITDLLHSPTFDYGFLASVTGGSSSTYIPDYFWQNTGDRAVSGGGEWGVTTQGGLFYTVANAASTLTARTTGARLAYTPPVVANFTYTNTSAEFAFADTSTIISTLTGLTGTPSSYNWSFGDGSISTEQNPTHIYAAAGTYNVNLTASDGTNYATKTESVTSPAGSPVAIFTPAGPQSRIAPAYMKWNQTSTGGPVTCLWQFGDGTSSTLCNVTHFYPLPGDYPVAFTATNAAGSSSNKTHVRVRLS